MEDPLVEPGPSTRSSDYPAGLTNGGAAPDDLDAFIASALAEQAIPCAACGSNITTTDGICINNKYYHRACFQCGLCSKLFSPADEIFMGADNQILCQDCKTSNPDKVKTAEVCVYCKRPIHTAAMVALDRKWHPECFVCTDCSVALTGFFRDSGGVPYCESCWLRNFAKRCRVCGELIADQVMTIEQHDYHVTCVRCVVCKKTFDNVLDILNIELEFWHVNCFKEDESETESTCSASSALLGVYNKSLGFSSASSPSTGPSSRKISTVSFANAPRGVADGGAVERPGSEAEKRVSLELGNGTTQRPGSRNKSSKCCVVS